MAMKEVLGLGEKLLEKKIDSDEIVEKEESLRKRVWEESKKIWRVAGPAIFTRFTSFGINIITQAFIGRTIGSTELAAYALVGTVLSRFVTGILVSLFFFFFFFWSDSRVSGVRTPAPAYGKPLLSHTFSALVYSFQFFLSLNMILVHRKNCIFCLVFVINFQIFVGLVECQHC